MLTAIALVQVSHTCEPKSKTMGCTLNGLSHQGGVRQLVGWSQCAHEMLHLEYVW